MLTLKIDVKLGQGGGMMTKMNIMLSVVVVKFVIRLGSANPLQLALLCRAVCGMG